MRDLGPDESRWTWVRVAIDATFTVESNGKGKSQIVEEAVLRVRHELERPSAGFDRCVKVTTGVQRGEES